MKFETRQIKTLILTGWGWKEYPVSAAVACKAMGEDADVIGMSRRRLPEFLEGYEDAYRRIVLIGISLSGDEPRLAAALAALRKRGIQVVWISAIDFTPSQREALAPLLTARVLTEGTLLEAVGAAYEIDTRDFAPYAVEEKNVKAPVRAWQELVDAAMYAYRNYQEMNAGLTDHAASELNSSPDELDAAMRLHVRHVFDKYGQNLSKTAAALKVARNTVRKYL